MQTVYAVHGSKAGILRALCESVVHQPAAEEFFGQALGATDRGVRGATDSRTLGALGDADPQVAAAWGTLARLAAADPPPMGVVAGDRPLADVEVLAAMLAATEYTLATRLHLAASAGWPLEDGRRR